MKYKEPKTFKGFEAWWHAIQMTAKMHITIFCIILFLQVGICLLLLYFIQKETFKLIFSAFTVLSPHVWLLALKVFVKTIFVYFLLTLPVWLLYPVFLASFKRKAKTIMQDEYLRGSRLVDEKELRDIVIKEIKREWQEEEKNN